MNKHVFQFDLMIQHLHHIKFVECTKRIKNIYLNFKYCLKIIIHLFRITFCFAYASSVLEVKIYCENTINILLLKNQLVIVVK